MMCGDIVEFKRLDNSLWMHITHHVVILQSRRLGFPQTQRYRHIKSVRYLPSRFDSLPDAEVNQNPDDHQTQHELPVNGSSVVQTRRDVQHLVPAQTEVRTVVQPQVD